MRANITALEAAGAPEQEIERAYRDLVNSLDDVVFRSDARGRWNYLSLAWTKRLGLATADCLGQMAVKFVHPAERGSVLRAWAEVVAGRMHFCRREVRFRAADGGYRWMLVSARELRDEGGNLCGVTGTLTDISMFKRIEGELIAARAAAEVANKSKSEFLSTMSHELRTPLNAVIGLSESLLELGPPFEPERTRRYLDIIHTSGRQLLAQINDILDLARIEAGRIQLNPEILDVRALCASVVDAAQREIRAKQLIVEVRAPADPIMITADDRLLRQILQNLVSNAVKFTPTGGSIGITLERSPAGNVCIAVRDTGIGIAPEKIPLLFKPFTQVDSSLARQFGGTGLGLALVERLVRLHGGTVTVRSALHAGSTFTLELPPGELPASRAPAVVIPRARTVLLVDDDPRQHTLVGDYLRDRGFTVEHCESGVEALKSIAVAEPGLAVIDVNMPGMSGLELIARLRREAHGKNLPILAVTALTESAAAERCWAAGANGHLPKPLSLGALAQRIASLTGLPL